MEGGAVRTARSITTTMLKGQVQLSLGYTGIVSPLPLLTPLTAGSGHAMAEQLDRYGSVTCFS